MSYSWNHMALTLSSLALGTVAPVGPGRICAMAEPVAPPPSGQAVRDDDHRVAAGTTNDFAFALYRRISEGDAGANAFFSPYSLLECLTLSTAGARGRTAAEMGRALAFPSSLGKGDGDAPWDLVPLHRGFEKITAGLSAGPENEPAGLREEIARLEATLAELNVRLEEGRPTGGPEIEATVEAAEGIAGRINELRPLVDPFELRVATRLWVQERYPIREAFRTCASRHYGADAACVDFADDTEGARRRINRWVEDRTEQRIRDLVPDGALDRTTRLVLTNAIYFKGEWAEPFSGTGTRDADFHLAGGGASTARLMSSRWKHARYAAFREDGACFQTPHSIPREAAAVRRADLYPGEDGFAMVELPYQGDRLSMLVIAPNRADGIRALERRLDGESLARWTARLEPRAVDVRLPAFKLEADYSMRPILEAMGMRLAFTDEADFSGITSDPLGLEVSVVLHNARLEVNEKGTEAAAASAVVFRMSVTAQRDVPFIPEFRADRPFVFLIRDRESGAILFMGRFVQPPAV